MRVRRDNAAAWSLYRDFGFQPLVDTVDLRLAQVPPVQKAQAADSRISLVPYNSQQWGQVRELARLTVPPNLLWLEVVSIADFRVGLDRRLAEWWAGLWTARKTWRVVARHGERVVAAMAVRVAGHRGNHSLVLHVHPDYRGEIEGMLITEALSGLQSHRERATYVTLPVSYAKILDVFKKYGFVEHNTLTLMRRSSI